MHLIYLLMALVGAVVPYFFFFQHFSDAGFGPGNFIAAAFENGAAGGLSADLLISSLVFWLWLWQRRAPWLWVYVIINLLIGLSCAWPAYLFVEARRHAPDRFAETMDR